jgi:hypothetical protein
MGEETWDKAAYESPGAEGETEGVLCGEWRGRDWKVCFVTRLFFMQTDTGV